VQREINEKRQQLMAKEETLRHAKHICMFSLELANDPFPVGTSRADLPLFMLGLKAHTNSRILLGKHNSDACR
jgi:hypothetical protein